MIRNLTHIADVDDLARELKGMLPVKIQFDMGKPTEEPEKDQWRRLNAHFHAGIIPELCRHTGMRTDEAKNLLSKTFALVEHHLDEEGNDVYIVESVGGMNLERLRRLVLETTQFLMENFGAYPEPPMELQTKQLK